MEINTNQVLKTLGGDEEIVKPQGEEPMTIGDVIANVLTTDQQGGKLKSYELARKFHNQDEIEIDQADLTLVKEALKRSEVYNNLVLGQTLKKLEK